MGCQISVITCTHNPRQAYLSRVIEALANQTVDLQRWEFLMIDNASDDPIGSWADISWHPQGRHLREEKLGLTPARLRGIREASADLLVFVDDDNVLAPDYLEQAEGLAAAWPNLGAFSGQVFAEFEVQPEEWTRKYWARLAVREFERDWWSNIPCLECTTPNGAGLCVTKSVAGEYLRYHENGNRKFLLDRTGDRLLSAGDLDLATTACDLGLGNGLFTSLRLTHLIPKERLREEYLLRLLEDQTFSFVVLQSFRSNESTSPRRTWKTVLADRLRSLMMEPRDRRFLQAVKNGQRKAVEFLSQVH
jgi:glycosyltransferase involved in cell wall biosynthesis